MRLDESQEMRVTSKVRIYSARYLHEVQIMHDVLRLEGFETEVRNKHLTSLAGELPFLETYVELWGDEADRALLEQAVQRHLSEKNELDDCLCPACGAEVPVSHGRCWRCEGEMAGRLERDVTTHAERREALRQERKNWPRPKAPMFVAGLVLLLILAIWGLVTA